MAQNHIKKNLIYSEENFTDNQIDEGLISKTFQLVHEKENQELKSSNINEDDIFDNEYYFVDEVEFPVEYSPRSTHGNNSAFETKNDINQPIRTATNKRLELKDDKNLI